MAKINVKGSIFQWTISASLTTVSQLLTIETDEDMPLIDSTDIASTIREYVANITTGGTASLEGYFDPDQTGYTNMRTDMLAGTSRACSIGWGSVPAGTEGFTAFVTRIRKTGSEGGLLRVSFELQGASTRTLA